MMLSLREAIESLKVLRPDIPADNIIAVVNGKWFPIAITKDDERVCLYNGWTIVKGRGL